MNSDAESMVTADVTIFEVANDFGDEIYCGSSGERLEINIFAEYWGYPLMSSGYQSNFYKTIDYSNIWTSFQNPTIQSIEKILYIEIWGIIWDPNEL